MAKITKEAFIDKFSPKFEGDDDALMEFLEDTSDSFTPDDKTKDEEIQKLRDEVGQISTERDLIKEQYIKRFMSGSNETSTFKEKEVEIPEPREAKVIDIKEI